MEKVKVTRSYQITIPKSIRRALRLKVGDYVYMSLEGGRIVIETRKKVADPVSYLWNLRKKPCKIDVVELIRRSRRRF